MKNRICGICKKILPLTLFSDKKDNDKKPNICKGCDMKHTEQWFKNRIGKKVFRDAVDCKCDTCEQGTVDGIKITDKQHSTYLYDVQCDMGINYRDKK